MKRIEGLTYNSDLKQFWCKRCKRATNVIYHDDNGESYCDSCMNKVEESEGVKEVKSAPRKPCKQRKLF